LRRQDTGPILLITFRVNDFRDFFVGCGSHDSLKKMIAEQIVFGAYQDMGEEILMKLKT